MSLRHGSLISLLAITPFVVGPAPAQVPEGFALVGTITNSGVPGTPGLFLVPLVGGPTIPITGLPPELSTVGNSSQGSHKVSIRSSDGAIVVTTTTTPTSPTAGNQYVFLLHLNGTAVIPALTQQILLGTATSGSGGRHALLPDERILVNVQQGGTSPLPMGPMANHRWAIVDPSAPTPTVTVLPEPPGIAGQLFASIAADPTGRYAYYTLSSTNIASPSVASLLRLDLVTGAECTIANWPGEAAFGVIVDDDGIVYVSSTNPTLVEHYMHTVVPNGCNPAIVTSVQSSLPILARGLAIDRASGNFVVASGFGVAGFTGPQLNAVSVVDRVTGAVTTISTTPAGGWGTIGRPTVNNFMDSYGAPTDGQNRYWFANFPNPTNYPYVGNTGFSLTMASAPGTAAMSAMSLSFGRGSTIVLGAEYLLDPANAVTTFVASGPSVSYPLSIPNNVGLAGVELTAQSLHLEANNVLAASRGLELMVTLLPAPIIDTVQPSAPLPNTTVTVTGNAFYSGMQLLVAGNPTPIASQTPTSLTFVMPTGVPCNSSITLTNVGGVPNSATLNGAPVISTMTMSGPAAGGAPFDVTGQYLDGTTVTFNGTPMTNIVTQTATEISGFTPAGAVGPAVVAITSATACQTTAAYTYHAIPVITGITPLVAGPATPVTVNGGNFLSGLTLRVGGSPTPITSWTASTLTFQMPAGNNCDTLVEVTNVGNITASEMMNRTPVVNFASTSGPAAGGAIFYVTGQYLLGATVTFNGVPVTSFIAQTATGIVGNTPPGAVGPASFVVSNALGCSVTLPYTYN